MTKLFNLTKVRLAALRLIHQRPDMDANCLANFLYEGNHIKWKGYYKDDAPRYSSGISGQSSARWSGNYIRPLIDAGLVKKSMSREYLNYRDILNLTDKGREALNGVSSF